MNHAMPRWRYGDASAAENPGPPEPSARVGSVQTMDLGHELVDAGGEQKVPRQTPKHDMNFTLFSYYILLYFPV